MPRDPGAPGRDDDPGLPEPGSAIPDPVRGKQILKLRDIFFRSRDK